MPGLRLPPHKASKSPQFMTSENEKRHLFNGLFSMTICVSWHHKSKPFWIFNEACLNVVEVALAGPCANQIK